ncbi:MAG: DNA-directed RNA polymerase subunit K [Aeropyrum sp.]|nr:DNA-directed RNA polymerase subunit K [Aeropyrum sp.]MCE4615692.1 DNA-directed RNA polymerase subunit K [Aeropyrum sp.]
MEERHHYSSYPRVAEDVKVGPPYLTKYERARIIGVRAFQLGLGALPLVDTKLVRSSDPIAIARYEVDNGILPVSVYRYTPGGEGQTIPLKRLVELAKEILGGEFI